MSGLIQSLEAAEGGSRELDAEIWAALRPERIKILGTGVPYGDNTGRTQVMFTTPPKRSEFVTSERGPWTHAEPVTTSLDAALALAERVLPGWYVGVQPWFHADPDRVMHRAYLIRPDWKRWNPTGDEWCDQHHGRSCATSALAVVSAILRAKEGGQ